MSSVAIHNWGVSVLDLTGMVHDDDLGLEGLDGLTGIIFGVGSHIASTDILDRYVLDVETNIVTGMSFQ